ncbi:hypothetical protein quinque_001070 [Culex quinquefasciatus]
MDNSTEILSWEPMETSLQRLVAHISFPNHPLVSIEIEIDSEAPFNPEKLTEVINLGCHAFIMDEELAGIFLDAFIRSHDLAMFRNPNKTVIVLRDPQAEVDGAVFLEDICRHPALRDIVRFLVVNPAGDRINLWTHRYVSSVEEAKELVFLDSYYLVNGSFALGNELFPDKTTNLARKLFKLASFRLIPHFIYTPIEGSQWLATYKNQTVKVDGMGGLVAVEFCMKFNCTWDLSIDQAGEWGRVYDNWTGDGIMGAVAERRADVGIGSLLTWVSAHRFFGFTATIRKVGIGCFVPRPRMIPSWQTVALAFSPSVWLCSVLSVACCIGMYSFLSHHDPSPNAERRSFGWNAMNVVAIFLFNGAKILYGSMSECILSIALVAFTINLGNIFIGKNASLRAFPLFEPPIDTVEDIANKDLIWVQTHEAWVHSLLLTQNPYLMKVAENFRIHSIPEMNELADQGEVGFAVSKLNYGHFMIGTFITLKNVMQYRMMSEDLYFEYEVSMTTKTWPLKDMLSDLILRIVASGVRAYQEAVVAKRYMDYGVQIKIFHSQDQEGSLPHPMRCEDLLAAFMVLGAGILLSVVAFLGEILRV